MKTLGLIGGMSWESSAIYYRLLNQDVKARLGGHHSAKIILYSVDFAEVERLQRMDRWEEAGEQLAVAARALEGAEADCIVLCTNTMHKVASQIESAVAIPLLHIADPTAAAVIAAGIKTIGLLATRFTMEQDFYVRRWREKFGIATLVPNRADRVEIHRVIYEELVHGKIVGDSRKFYTSAIERLIDQGAQGIVLGCTEIGLLVSSATVTVPCFDTTQLHAKWAVDFALSSP